MALFKKKNDKDDVQLQEVETKVGIEGGKPTIVRRWISKRVVKENKPKTELIKEVKNKVFDKEYSIKPYQYVVDTLGIIGRDSKIRIEAKENFGSNFSLLIMDSDNAKLYKKEGLTRGAIYQSKDEPMVNVSLTIQRSSEYFLVITSRAIDIPRKVWVRIEIHNSI